MGLKEPYQPVYTRVFQKKLPIYHRAFWMLQGVEVGSSQKSGRSHGQHESLLYSDHSALGVGAAAESHSTAWELPEVIPQVHEWRDPLVSTLSHYGVPKRNVDDGPGQYRSGDDPLSSNSSAENPR